MLQLEMKTFKTLFLVVLLGSVVIPFLYAFKYVGLYADDYGRALWEFKNIGINISNWYLTHNGRIMNAIFSCLPVYKTPWLHSILILNFILNFFVLHIVIHRLLKVIGLYIFGIDKLIITSIIFVLQICALPLIFEYYYWYAGVTAYSLSFLSLLLCLFFVLGILNNNKKSITGAIFFGILCAGNNEILILLLNYLVLILVVFSFLKRKDILMKALILQFCILVISGVVVFSPGSLHRQNSFESGGNILGSLVQSLISSFSLLVNEFKILNSVLGIVTLLLIAVYLVKRSADLNKLKYLNPIVLSIISLIGIFLLLYVPTYATGGLNYNKGRIANMIQIVLLIVMLINIVNATIFISIERRYSLKINQNRLFTTMLLFSLATAYTSENIQNLFVDYNEGNFKKLTMNRNNRIKLITDSNLINISVPAYNGNLTFQFEDMSSDPNHWYNIDFVNFMNQKYNLEIETVRVKID